MRDKAAENRNHLLLNTGLSGLNSIILQFFFFGSALVDLFEFVC